MSSLDTLQRLAEVIESRKPANGGDPDKSYVARLLHKGPDAFLKKIGEEACEVVMAFPIFPEITIEQQQRVVQACSAYLRRQNRRAA